MPNPYIYSISADMPSGAVNEGKLHVEIDASAIGTELLSVQANGNVLTITFTGDLSVGDKTIFDGANLRGVDLSHFWRLTQAQLDRACGDGSTRLKPGFRVRPCQ